jgi:hypothetical protein
MKKIIIKKWFIFTELGPSAVPYVFDGTNLDIIDEEIDLCILNQFLIKERKDGRKL